MRMTITNIQGVPSAASTVAELRNTLQGVTEDADGDLVQTGPALDGAKVGVTIEGIDPATLASICELIETAGGRYQIAAEAL
jgi:hypothetical protein